MNCFYLDAVCIFTSPFVASPEDVIRSKLIEWVVQKLLEQQELETLTLAVPRLRFLTRRQLESLFSIIEEVCRLVDLPPGRLEVIDNTVKVECTAPELTEHDSHEDVIHFQPATSHFEGELLGIFTPLLNYKRYYSLYGLPLMDSILICGPNSGMRFTNWVNDFNSQITRNATPRDGRRLDLHIIRIEDILSPYFGESERKLVFLFEKASSTKSDGITCIFLEGLHHFHTNRDGWEDLDRRLLTTLLLLLDSVTKEDFLSQHRKGLDYTRDKKASVMVVATSESHPDNLPDALTRPGRLNRILLL